MGWSICTDDDEDGDGGVGSMGVSIVRMIFVEGANVGGLEVALQVCRTKKIFYDVVAEPSDNQLTGYRCCI